MNCLLDGAGNAAFRIHLGFAITKTRTKIGVGFDFHGISPDPLALLAHHCKPRREHDVC